MKTARATGVLALQEHGLKEVPQGLLLLVNLRVSRIIQEDTAGRDGCGYQIATKLFCVVVLPQLTLSHCRILSLR